MHPVRSVSCNAAFIASIALGANSPIDAANADSVIGVDYDFRVSAALDDGDINQAQATISPEWRADVTTRMSLTVSARLRGDIEDDLDPGQPNVAGYAGPSRPLLLDDYGALELRDAHLTLSSGDIFLRVGKQQIVWGELEGFKLLDIVNPQSFREFILEDFGDSRIGLWSVNAEYMIPGDAFGSWSAQLVWTPDPTVHEIPNPGATFEFQAPRFRFGDAPNDGPLLPFRTERRTDVLAASGIGGRLVGLVDGWDLSLQAYSGIDPEPLARLEASPAGAELVRFNRRRTLLGVSAARTFGDVTFRGEMGLQPKRRFPARTSDGQLAVASSDQFSAAFVADFNAPGDIFVSIQFLYDRLLDWSDSIVRPREDFLTSLYLRRNFANERLQATLRWYASEGGADGVIRPKLSFEITDNSTVELNADIFYGNGDGIFGQFDGEDRVVLAFRGAF